jgi:hypothetical protein
MVMRLEEVGGSEWGGEFGENIYSSMCHKGHRYGGQEGCLPTQQAPNSTQKGISPDAIS